MTSSLNSTSQSIPSALPPPASSQGDPTPTLADRWLQSPSKELPPEVDAIFERWARDHQQPSSSKEGRLHGSQGSLRTEGSSSGDDLDGIHVIAANGDLGATALKVRECAWEKRPFCSEK